YCIELPILETESWWRSGNSRADVPNEQPSAHGHRSSSSNTPISSRTRRLHADIAVPDSRLGTIQIQSQRANDERIRTSEAGRTRFASAGRPGHACQQSAETVPRLVSNKSRLRSERRFFAGGAHETRQAHFHDTSRNGWIGFVNRLRKCGQPYAGSPDA